MDSKHILTAFYINGAAQFFEESIDNALNKKKHKRVIISKEDLANQYSIFNFIEVRQCQGSQYFIARQLLRSHEDKEDSQRYEQKMKKIKQVEEDIKKFKLLQQKIVKIKDQDFVMHNKHIKKDLIKEQVLRLFPNTDLNDKLESCSVAIQRLKNENIDKVTNALDTVNQKMLFLRSRLQSYREIREMHSMMLDHAKIQHPNVSYDKESAEEKVHSGISLTIQDYFIRVLKAVSFESFLKKSKMVKKWESNFLLQEEQELIGKKIKGKMLYQVQEVIYKQKSSLQCYHVNKEYFIRQKKYGLHQNKMKKINYALQFDYSEEISQNLRKDKLKTLNRQVQQHKIDTNLEKEENQFDERDERPKSKSQLFLSNRSKHSYKAPLTNPTTQPLRLKRIDSSNISELNKNILDNRSKSKRIDSNSNKVNNYLQRYKKPTYQRLQNIETFSFQRQRNTSTASNPFKNHSANSILPVKINKLLKYPIKIEHLQIYLSESSMICYHVDQIQLKELTLKFIQDRLKFKENKVKIEYPQRYTKEDELKVMKSMQILNCLGAEVSCEPETNYKYWNQTDERDILTASWVLQLPVRVTINCYLNYLLKIQTKK